MKRSVAGPTARGSRDKEEKGFKVTVSVGQAGIRHSTMEPPPVRRSKQYDLAELPGRSCATTWRLLAAEFCQGEKLVIKEHITTAIQPCWQRGSCNQRRPERGGNPADDQAVKNCPTFTRGFLCMKRNGGR